MFFTFMLTISSNQISQKCDAVYVNFSDFVNFKDRKNAAILKSSLQGYT
jgi:hypothetical protein